MSRSGGSGVRGPRMSGLVAGQCRRRIRSVVENNISIPFAYNLQNSRLFSFEGRNLQQSI